MKHHQVPIKTPLYILFILPTALLATLAAGQKQVTPSPVAGSELFESKVRPLLLASCVSCHGKESAQGGLRLDAAISIEKAKEVIRRVKGEGGKPRMPLGGELPKAKIEALEQWVQGGAVWPTARAVPAQSLMEKGKTHWSFLPLNRPAVPKVKMASWVRNPIDAFILRKLEAKGLHPNPSASRRELIRRLSYDLTGLPPTPEEVAAFEADKAPNAYEKLVDRLLASPHYGEKWARHWLDLVRYAETNSYERDNPKPYIYKYRDYVIRAFNEDKPYDQFLKEQIAGDEMADATGDAVLATAYYRLGIWDDEPADKAQAAYDDLDDLVATTGQAFLGLTLDCARCHDHKLDPIPQKDYYRFVSFFHNINRFRNGGATDEARYFPTPESKRDYERKIAELDVQRKANQAEVAAIEAQLTAKGTQVINPGDITGVDYRYYERDWKRIPDFENEPVISSGKLPSFLSIKPRERNEDFAFDFNGTLNVAKEGDYTFRFCSEGGFRFTVAGERLFDSFASDGKPVDKMAKKHLSKGQHGISLIFNQRQHQYGLAISWSGPDFTNRPLTTLDSCGTNGLAALLGPDLPNLLGKEKAAQLADLVEKRAALEKQVPPTEKVLCVTEAGPKSVDTFVMLRGVPTAPGEKVEPAFPICVAGNATVQAVVPPSGKSTGRRTALANWMASPNNPLTARVIVNRIWQHHFGRGIVRSPNDFGLQGAPPTHPELLDWMAKEFIAQGWSFKKLHRLILTSNTYKQSSRGNTVALEKDPQNDLLWRSDMRRLTAEEIRDSLLAVSGNLNLAMFGPSVYPEIPKEILAAQSRPGKDWFTERMTPADMNRRSIYIFVKRSLIYPLFASFDLPETDRSAAFRFASTQPTQALGLMNGPLFNKQATVLADRVRHEAGANPAAFSRRLFTLVLQRPATEKEVSEGVRLMARLEKRGVKPEQAQNYLCLMALNLDEFLYVD
jgi:mono/diheme cytochrome c family protein